MIGAVYLLPGSSFSQDSTSSSYDTTQYDLAVNIIEKSQVRDTEAFILGAIRDHRVVLLGDYGHGSYKPVEKVVNVLHRWVSAFEGSDPIGLSLPRHIVLVLERNAQDCAAMEAYIESGNPADCLKMAHFCDGAGTTNHFEICYDVRRIRQRIALFNKNRPREEHLELSLLGPEKTIEIDGWSRAKADTFFFHKRDEYASDQIITFLTERPEAHAVVYYGGGHLNLGLINKHGNFGSAKGYFLAHYLNEAFKDHGGSYSIEQNRYELVGGTNPLGAFEYSYALDYEYLLEGGVEYDEAKRYDAVIIYHEKLQLCPSISTIPSATLIDYFSENLVRFADMEGEFARSYVYVAAKYLFQNLRVFPPRDQWENASFLQEWTSQLRSSDKLSSFSATQRIQSMDDIKAVISKLAHTEESQDQIRRINFELLKLTTHSMEPKEGENSEAFAQRWTQWLSAHPEQYIYPRLVALLWLGEPSERIDALQLLREETGEEFETAKEWSMWLNEQMAKGEAEQ
jgi:hypothetical protein